jgi:hypothetical protein
MEVLEMIVYKITNLLNNKIYIGKDKTNNPNYFGSGLLIRNAIKKYGKENFTKDILEFCSSEEQLNEKERYWIDYYKSYNRDIGYNLTLGGDGGDTFTNSLKQEQTKEKLRQNSTGKKHSEESRLKISKAREGKGNGMFGKVPWNKGSELSDQTKEKIGQKNKGKLLGIPKSEHVKKCVSDAQKGKSKSNDHKQKISDALIGRKLKTETIKKMSESKKGIPQKIITCPHCGKSGGTTMYRWHFDNCKKKY